MMTNSSTLRNTRTHRQACVAGRTHYVFLACVSHEFRPEHFGRVHVHVHKYILHTYISYYQTSARVSGASLCVVCNVRMPAHLRNPRDLHRTARVEITAPKHCLNAKFLVAYALCRDSCALSVDGGHACARSRAHQACICNSAAVAACGSC